MVYTLKHFSFSLHDNYIGEVMRIKWSLFCEVFSFPRIRPIILASPNNIFQFCAVY